MKINSLICAGLLLLGFVFITPETASSEEVFRTKVTVDSVVQHTNYLRVRLSEVGVSNPFTNKLFDVPAEKANQMLAILLTARSLGDNLSIAFFDGTPAKIILITIED